ncbi:hypothetical protein BcepIL02_gp30 [Burkholderia phage BcepIL02]|uniref:Uncharacterized protein n=1 Tax=Burkholderia phage BcepIL02 TaxID=2886898 RepID=C5IHM2_9CAUD|nr:hypothetical protein BcepIL02_gp30 [Burkholderia phage BcepIL02]ACR15023.1 hypothetical protein BcepIL02_gp30 [Burkholderia phage BcepIL02]
MRGRQDRPPRRCDLRSRGARMVHGHGTSALRRAPRGQARPTRGVFVQPRRKGRGCLTTAPATGERRERLQAPRTQERDDLADLRLVGRDGRVSRDHCIGRDVEQHQARIAVRALRRRHQAHEAAHLTNRARYGGHDLQGESNARDQLDHHPCRRRADRQDSGPRDQHGVPGAPQPPEYGHGHHGLPPERHAAAPRRLAGRAGLRLHARPVRHRPAHESRDGQAGRPVRAALRAEAARRRGGLTNPVRPRAGHSPLPRP